MSMKNLLLLFAFIFISLPALAAKTCDCKCTVKEEDGTYTIIKASGKDREEAGENLKKNLKKQKCELSPVCTGACDI